MTQLFNAEGEPTCLWRPTPNDLCWPSAAPHSSEECVNCATYYHTCECEACRPEEVE